VSCYCGGRKSASKECWPLPEVSTNGVEGNHSSAKGYIFLSIVGKLKRQTFSGCSMGASTALYKVHEIPTKQEEEEG